MMAILARWRLKIKVIGLDQRQGLVLWLAYDAESWTLKKHEAESIEALEM